MIRLEMDGVTPLVVDDWSAGFNTSSLDLGWPNTRAVASDRPGTNGTIDETRFFGARSVALKLDVYEGYNGASRRNVLNQLARFTYPGARPTLYYVDPGDPAQIERRLDLRAEQGSAPMPSGTGLQVQVSWVAPSGLITSAVERSISLPPSAPAPGITFDVTFDVVFPAYTAGPGAAANLGTIPSHWTAMLYGPFTGPALKNRNSDQQLYFPGLTIASGDYLEIDSLNRTVLVNGVESATRYSYLDFASSTWWVLGAGASLIEFTADSSAPPAVATLTWADSFII